MGVEIPLETIAEYTNTLAQAQGGLRAASPAESAEVFGLLNFEKVENENLVFYFPF